MFHQTLVASCLVNFFLPSLITTTISGDALLTSRHLVLLQCLSLLFLGMFLATLATLNFSLAFLVGILATPLSFIGQPLSFEKGQMTRRLSVLRILLSNLVLHLLSPPVVVLAICKIFGVEVEAVLAEAAFGWKVSGLWTQVVVCCVWWPAWLVGAVIVSPFL